MRVAPAKESRQCIGKVGFGGIRVLIDERLAVEHRTADAIAALGGLFLDKSGLNRVRSVRGTKTFDRQNLMTCHLRHGGRTGTNRLAIHQYRARTAFGKAAAEFWTI